MPDENIKKQHPIKILKLTTKNFWLLLIPLIRGLVALRWDFYTWAQGAWFDILIILIIGWSAYLRWYFTEYNFNENSVHLKTGVILKKDYTVPFSSICAVSAERRFFFRPIKAVNIYFDTNSGSHRKADVQITIRQSDYEILFDLLSKKITSKGIRTSYKPSKVNLVLFSFLFSSTLSGVIFIATLLIESSKIIGRSVEDTLMTAVTDVSDKLFIKLPPVALAISLILCAGWLFSFISNLLRHLDFTIRRTNKIIEINNGFFTKRHYYINSEKINYADLQQNLLAKLFSIMSVHVNCSGYGKAKNEISVFVPITTKSQVYSSLRLLLPDMAVIPNGIKPWKRYFFRFIWIPFFAIIIIAVIATYLYRAFPIWNSMILFLTIMSEIPIIWLLIIRFVDFLTTRIAFSDKNLCLKYSSGFAFHTIIVPKNKIAEITITQSIFQILSKSCDVRIYTNNEFTKYHTIISMPIDDILLFLEKADLLFIKINKFRK